jgi:hypothetical protein
MPEVLAQFDQPIQKPHGPAYRAQACGAPMPDGLWEAWIEFIPLDGGPPVRSPRETTQPNKVDTAYWASGLSVTYLEGALERALRPPAARVTSPAAEPIFNTPAPGHISVEVRARVHAILDPFSVYEKGEIALRQKLGALSVMHLVNIIFAYNLSDEPPSVLNRLPHEALVEIITLGVQARLSSQRT